MLKRFEVSNYKNFKKPLVVDFGRVGGYQFNLDCISDKTLSKIFIYGRNATGKTNLGYALLDIASILNDTVSRKHGEFFLNGDAEEDYASFSYTFQFGKDEIVYCYKKSAVLNLIDEEMFLNGKKLFRCDFINREVSDLDLKDIYPDPVNSDRFIEVLEANSDITQDEDGIQVALPFFRWLTSNIALTPDSVLMKLRNFIQKMRYTPVSHPDIGRFALQSFYKSLEKEENLQDFEEFLNTMGVDCKLECQKLPDGQNELYFKHKTPLPFSVTASSGTHALTTLYRRLQIMKSLSLVYMDEFDAFYHFEMSDNIVRYIKHAFPSCQVIFTTHNTNLMSNHLLRPDCVCILSRDGKLTPLCDATPRELREGHNLEKMFISGEFNRYE